jgi:hypothetical protein
VRLTVRHVYDFGADRALVGDDLVRPDAWDALRTRTDGPFAMATSAEQAEHDALAHPGLRGRADALADWLSQERVQRLVSYGVGAGAVEVLVRRRGVVDDLVVTEYAPETVARLRQVLPGVEVVHHDLLSDPPLEGDVHLFHRIDTEFDNRQLRGVLDRFAGRRVLVIVTSTVNVREAMREVVYRVRNRNVSRAGWSRSAATFEALWRHTHDARPLTFHDLPAWDLTPRRG